MFAATRPFGPPKRRKLSVTDSAQKTAELVAQKLGISYHKPGVRFPRQAPVGVSGFDDRPLPHPAIRGLVMRQVVYHPHSYVTKIGEATLTVRAIGGRYLVERAGNRHASERMQAKGFNTPREVMLFLNVGRIKALMDRPPLMLPAPKPETLAALRQEQTRREEHLKRIARVGNKVLASKKTTPSSATVIALPGGISSRSAASNTQPALLPPGDDVAYYECIAARCGGWLEEDIASIFDDHEIVPPIPATTKPASGMGVR